MTDDGLFSEFPEVSTKQWKQKIQFDLDGADYNKTLVWESPEGINVKPFYNAEDVVANSIHINHPKSWSIAQHIYAGNEQMANKKALDVLQRGAESLVFTIPSEETAIETLLSDIDVSTTSLHFNFQFLSATYIEKLLAYLDNSSGECYLNIDPIGHLARTGNWYFNLKKDHEILDKIHLLTQNSKNISMLGVDVALYQNAGATMVQQLAYALAHGNEYLNHFQNVTSSKVERSICFNLAVGSNYFFEIAKIKTLRLLLKMLASEYNIEPECHIIAIPSKRNKTLYDYNVNMLRTTSECMSAILGGADTVCNLPYDSVYHKDNEFADRIARNQLLLLKEEVYFNQVENATEGAYYIESLTKQLAEKALTLFKSIEKNGGFLNQLKAHSIQKEIKESAQKEQERFNSGKEILVGTNKFINQEDSMKDSLELYPFVKINARKTLLIPIIEKRLAEELEQSRLKNE